MKRAEQNGKTEVRLRSGSRCLKNEGLLFLTGIFDRSLLNVRVVTSVGGEKEGRMMKAVSGHQNQTGKGTLIWAQG